MKHITFNTYLITIFILTTLLSCNQTNSPEPEIEKVITELTNKFSQLPKGTSNPLDYYKLVRSVTNGEMNFEIQLRSAPDTIEDPQQIIIFKNALGQYYAIPFFSNTYRDYWEFQFDSPLPSVKPTNTTFEKEFISALNTLNFNDTIGTVWTVIDEMLSSLLRCSYVTKSDSTELLTLYLNNNYNIPVENSDSGFQRLQKNYAAISDKWLKQEFLYRADIYFDAENYRVYQICNSERLWRNKPNLSITVYRQDVVFHQTTY